MAIRTVNLGGQDFKTGDNLTDTDLNDTFNELYNLFHISNW